MSHDLFAAFGTPALSGPSSSSRDIDKAADQFAVDLQRPNRESRTLPDGDDDFGDFEDASAPDPPSPQVKAQQPSAEAPFPPKAPKSSAPKPASSGPPSKAASKSNAEVGQHPFAGKWDLLFDADDDEYDAGADEITDLATNPEAAMAYSKRVIEAQQAEEAKAREGISPSVPSASGQQGPEARTMLQSTSVASARDSDVLFDVEVTEKEGDGDEFGDFEDFEATSNGAKSTEKDTRSAPLTELDLLSLDDTTSKPSPSKVWNPSTIPPASSEDAAEDEAWDDFEESSATTESFASGTANPPPAMNSAFQHATSAIAAKPSHASTTDALPPINIPPPVVLLSIFPSLLTSGQEALLDPLARLDLKQRQILLAHPATHMFLRGYLSLAAVLGHIIAGRKQRWKRDHYLAQGMRIGPAAAGGKGGMKLTGIDKGEVAKEDREVSDVVRMWKGQIGKLRGAVVAASAATVNGEAKMPAVPDISEQMPVKTLKPAEGGVTASSVCALCGLKREERVAKVDVEIEDSFGEWWIEGMNMHLVCRNFWEEHKSKLKSR